MAHNISIVPATVAGVNATDIPSPETIDELEKLWAHFTANPGVWGHYDGGSAAELATYKRQANNYLKTRKEGALKLRQIRRQKLPEHQMKFIIEPATANTDED